MKSKFNTIKQNGILSFPSAISIFAIVVIAIAVSNALSKDTENYINTIKNDQHTTQIVANIDDTSDASNDSTEEPTIGNEEEPTIGNEEEPTIGNEEEPTTGNKEEPTTGNEEEPTTGNESNNYNTPYINTIVDSFAKLDEASTNEIIYDIVSNLSEDVVNNIINIGGPLLAEAENKERILINLNNPNINYYQTLKEQFAKLPESSLDTIINSIALGLGADTTMAMIKDITNDAEKQAIIERELLSLFVTDPVNDNDNNTGNEEEPATGNEEEPTTVDDEKKDGTEQPIDQDTPTTVDDGKKEWELITAFLDGDSNALNEWQEWYASQEREESFDSYVRKVLSAFY